ncbi:uncharacterized protein LOC128092391 [Culex pipiens pallens]|uniref:uncharacterized protein LOC128092391 n=1 Tax=Culex pipiens pallens TaxID=42434 RepID=UPI0022AB3771|nr:uncharacterized protein LOC128092391 [Culex pipiens pallens]
MKRHDIYVNGSMVKEGFAVSSGSVSVVVERIKEDIPEKDDEGAVVVVKVEAAEQKSVEEAGNRTLRNHSTTSEGQQRTKSVLAVSILWLVDPGELTWRCSSTRRGSSECRRNSRTWWRTRSRVTRRTGRRASTVWCYRRWFRSVRCFLACVGPIGN